jgi:hypothetical protein
MVEVNGSAGNSGFFHPFLASKEFGEIQIQDTGSLVRVRTTLL